MNWKRSNTSTLPEPTRAQPRVFFKHCQFAGFSYTYLDEVQSCASHVTMKFEDRNGKRFRT